MKEVWTTHKAIQWAVPLLKQRQVWNPRFSAISLVALGLGVDPIHLHLQFNRRLKPVELKRIRGYIRRRMGNEPLEYILGETHFFGFPFKVTPAVLRPRPETGRLVELALDYLATLPEEKRKVLDLGTGCGCIAVSVARYIPCKVWAVDISGKALAVAKENADKLGVGKAVQWRKGSWFSALKNTDPAQFQVILCNPPYIAGFDKKILNREITSFEPTVAVFGGISGLKPYQEIARGFEKWLSPGGKAFLELEPIRAGKIRSLFKNQARKSSFGMDDYGVKRVLVLEN